MPKRTWKWKFKHDIQRFNHGVSHMNISDDPEDTYDRRSNASVVRNDYKSTTSRQIDQTLRQKYALDFEAWKFGRICIPEIRAKIHPVSIQRFFEDIQKVSKVSVVVNNPDHPKIEPDTHIFVKAANLERHLPVSFFWAVLSRDIKNLYTSTDYYVNLENLLTEKWIRIELEQWTDDD